MVSLFDGKPLNRKANRSWSATITGYLLIKCDIIVNLDYTKLLPKIFHNLVELNIKLMKFLKMN